MSKLKTNRIQLRKQVTCLNCWIHFAPEDIVWVWQHQDLLGDPVLGEDEQMRFLPAHFTIHGDAVDPRGEVCRDVACPRCHLQIPRELVECDSNFVSIVGSPACGKSYFLGSLVWSLRRTLPNLFQVEFSDADPATNRLLHAYEESLFLRPQRNNPILLGDLIPKTQLGGDMYRNAFIGQQEVRYPKPFAFLIKPQRTQCEDLPVDGQSHMICLYDNAGEHFLPGNDTIAAPGTRHLAMSSLLMILYDPTQDPRILHMLKESRADHLSKHPTSRQETIIQEVGMRIRRHSNLERSAKIGRPIFLVVTKSDLWTDQIQELWSAEPFRKVNGAASFALDTHHVDRVSGALRQILLRYVPEVVSSVESLSDAVRYIPVSAIGNRPTHDDRGAYQILPERLSPTWVTVPFISGLTRSLPDLFPRCKKKTRRRVSDNLD